MFLRARTPRVIELRRRSSGGRSGSAPNLIAVHGPSARDDEALGVVADRGVVWPSSLRSQFERVASATEIEPERCRAENVGNLSEPPDVTDVAEVVTLSCDGDGDEEEGTALETVSVDSPSSGEYCGLRISGSGGSGSMG